MLKHLVGMIGLALAFGSGPLMAGDGACCGDVGCKACNTCNAGAGCCERGCHHGGIACCPRCGCSLVPVCHTWCEPKTTSIHNHGCVCEEICIPGVSRCGEGCGDHPCCGKCEGGCNACNSCPTCNAGNGGAGGDEGCGCHCRVREIHKLVIYPATKCSSVKKCSVEWVCPQCHATCPCSEGGATIQNAQPAPAPQKPMIPAAPRLPVKQTSNVAPLPPMPLMDQ
jgi:hypothetical protein